MNIKTFRFAKYNYILIEKKESQIVPVREASGISDKHTIHDVIPQFEQITRIFEMLDTRKTYSDLLHVGQHYLCISNMSCLGTDVHFNAI